jgi:hypothetical protein
MANLTVANTIKDQLGRVALFAIGARNLVGGETFLQFGIGRNAKGVNKIRIELMPDDTYTVSFWFVRKAYLRLIAQETDVYVDSLHDSIDRNTGLYTRP